MAEIQIELTMSVEDICKSLDYRLRQLHVQALAKITQGDTDGAAEITKDIGDTAYYMERIQNIAYDSRRLIIESARCNGATDGDAAKLRNEGRYPLLPPPKDLDGFAQRRS